MLIPINELVIYYFQRDKCLFYAFVHTVLISKGLSMERNSLLCPHQCPVITGAASCLA